MRRRNQRKEYLWWDVSYVHASGDPTMKVTFSPTSRKHALIAVVVLLIPMIPSFLLFPLGLPLTMGQFICGVLSALLCTAMIGARTALVMSAVLTVAVFLAFLSTTQPVLAGLVMAATAGLYGLSARRGLAGVVTAAPISVAFTMATPPQVLTDATELQSATVLALVSLAGALWGVVVGTVVMRSRHRSKVPVTPVHAAIALGVILAIVTGITMSIVVAKNLQNGGAWIILTVLVISQPALGATWRKAIERLIGTAIGFCIAFVISLVVPHGWVDLLIALVFFAIVVYVKLDSSKHYWQYTMFLTPAVVLVVGSSSNVLTTDVWRVTCTVIGAAISMGIVVVLHWLNKFKPVKQAVAA